MTNKTTAEDVTQPSTIKSLLEEKYQHRKDIDDLGFTGHYKLSPKEVLDIIIDLNDSYQSRLNAIAKEVEGLIEEHANIRDLTDRDKEYMHNHGIVEGCAKVLKIINKHTE